MTEDVAHLVLRNNYQQTLAISLEQRRGLDNLGNQMRLMGELEERGLLDRGVEDLPADAALETRAAGRPWAHPLRDRHAPRLCQDRALQRSRRQRRPRRRLSRRASFSATFPEEMRKRSRRGDRRPSAAPRDHRDAARELPHQSRRADAACRGARPHRRFGGGTDARLRRRARQFCAAGAACRDRRARHEDIRPAAARTLCDSAGRAGRPHELVHAQHGCGRRPCRDRLALSRIARCARRDLSVAAAARELEGGARGRARS